MDSSIVELEAPVELSEADTEVPLYVSPFRDDSVQDKVGYSRSFDFDIQVEK